MDCKDPFGGKVILLGGDFRQVLPVIKHGGQADIIESSLKRSFLWSLVKTLHLTINMRVQKRASHIRLKNLFWMLEMEETKLLKMECPLLNSQKKFA